MSIEPKEALSTKTLNRMKRTEFIQKYGIFVIFLVIVALFAVLTRGNILSIRNFSNILVSITPVTLIAMGVTLVIITTGIDLSSGSVLACSAVVAASLAQMSGATSKVFPNMPELPFIIPLLAGLAVGALAGFINGILITKTGIPPFIATLGMMTSARGIALMYTSGNPVSGLHPAFKWLGQGSFLGIPVPILVLVLMIVVSHVLLKHTRFGRYTYAIGGNIKAAQVSGVRTDNYLIMVYTYAGLLAGLAGIMITGVINSAQPVLGVSYELDAIASAVVGGTSLYGGVGSIPGTIVGSLLIGVLKNSMDLMFINAYWQQIIRGIIIILAVMLDVQKQKLRSLK